MSIDWLHDWDSAMERSLKERRPVLIDVMKVPCAGCRKLDSETFTDQRVQKQIADRFIPLKLNLFEDPRSVLRPLNVIWTPTILFADRRGTVHYQNVNFLPPELFLMMLDIGESQVDLRWTRFDAAIERLKTAYESAPDSALAPELLYWWGMSIYLKTHDNPQMYEVWDVIRERFPGSIWAARIP